MPRFSLPVFWQMYGHVMVEAATLDDAIKIAVGPQTPLPPGNYVDDSFVVDMDIVGSEKPESFIVTDDMDMKAKEL